MRVEAWGTGLKISALTTTRIHCSTFTDVITIKPKLLMPRSVLTDRESAAGDEVVDRLCYIGRVCEIVVRVRVLAVAAL